MSRTQTIIFAPNLLLFMAIKAVKIGFSNLLLFMTSYDLADTLSKIAKALCNTAGVPKVFADW